MFFRRGKPSYSIGGPSPKIPKLEMGLPVEEPEPKADAVIVENGKYNNIMSPDRLITYLLFRARVSEIKNRYFE